MGIAIVDMEKLPSEPAPVYIKAGILDFYSQLEKINEATPEGQIYDLLCGLLFLCLGLRDGSVLPEEERLSWMWVSGE